jgi:hypothetical protein
MTAGVGRPINPVLYIEGKRLDNAFISATCTAAIGKPATAVIALVPTNAIRHILPRTYVQLFCNDPWNLESAEPVLLFEGEVLGIGFGKNDDARSFIIHCADVSNYWHHVRQYWFNMTQSGGNFLDQFIHMTTSGAGRIATVAPFGVKGYLLQRLNLVKDEENLFLDSMIGLLDDIGNISAFYQNARRRLRITDRILRKNAGQVQNLMQLSFFSDWMQQLIQARSGETNLLSIVTLLLNTIYHEYVSILAPPFINSEVLKRDKFGNPIRKKDGKRNIKAVETETKRVVANFVFKPHIYTIPPPSCNVLFPNMFDGIQYNRNFMEENTRMTLTPQVVEKKSPLNTLKLKAFRRPQELDSFFQMMVSGSGNNRQMRKRPATAKYGDGQGQSSHVQDWELFTNEERFKGINPKFQKLAPAPAILSLQNQGKKDAKGTPKGGVPKYMHNVASYEFFMNKFSSRQLTVSGLFNIRPVPGYPILMLDDSDANLNLVAYLHGITHTLNASSGVSTGYTVVLPREIDEIDLNRPRLDKDSGKFEFEVDNGEQVFNFEKMFDSEHQPPIPDWFDDSFKTIGKLTELYQSMFGPDVVSAEDIRGSEIALANTQDREAFKKEGQSFTETVADKTTNTIFRQAVKMVISDYRLAQKSGSEFEFASSYTKRTFTTVTESFRFLGAIANNLGSSGRPPVADTEYVGSTILGEFTAAEVDPTGQSTSTEGSGSAIYNGRPIAHPFELEMYKESVTKANKDNEKSASGKKARTPTSAESAPTGSQAEDNTFKPLSFPLAEREIIKARRSIINLYRKELEGKRGFRG